MSRRKKKSTALKAALKYELYGIIILILSVIALSQAGSFSRSLNYLSRFLIGTWDFVIPLYFIYIGLFVMMKREWPKFWTARKTGVLLFVLGLLIMSHISLFKQLHPEGGATVGIIIGETWTNMFHALPPSPHGEELLSHHVGGGMIGALIYGILYFLFDNLGATLIQFMLFAIGFILVTGMSLVDAGGKVRKEIRRWRKGLQAKLSRMIQLNKKRKQQMVAAHGEHFVDDDEEEEVDEVPADKVAKKKIHFFQLFQSSKVKHSDEDEDNDALKDDESNETWPAEVDTDNIQLGEPDLDSANKEQAVPLVRDFRDHAEQLSLIEPAQPELAPVVEELEATEGAEDVQLRFNESTISVTLDNKKAEQATEGVKIAPVEKIKKPYTLPSFNLLSRPAGHGKNNNQSNHLANARKLEMTLESFGVRAKVLDVVHGPAVTRYEIQPDIGVKVSRIVSLTDDIALALAAKDIRMEAPIPGKSAIGIEVPNTEIAVVTMREVMESTAFQESSSKLSIVLGRDISGKPIVGDLAKMPHLLVAGATGSGKSVCINGIITSLLYKAKPEEVKLLMVDPKMVELNMYNGIPHLLAPVVTDPRRASLALKKIVMEMEKRYELFSTFSTRNIEGYNSIVREKETGEPLPYIVVILDELADLMMVAADDVEDSICRLAQKARAAGIHLIIATQRPSVDVITGLIKANIPSRIAFGVSSQVDSRTILDMAGAEKLLGRGDMLYLPVGASKPVRVQGAFLTDHEVEAIVHFVKSQEEAQYQEEIVPEVDEQADMKEEFVDELYDQAVQIVLEAKQASVSLLQRRMRIGYTRAARLIDSMEANGVVGPYEGSKPREVRITLEQYEQNRNIS